MPIWLFILITIPAVLIILGFLLPDHCKVERRETIFAPREKVFAHISDFQKWSAWSPWAGLDPEMKMEITGTGLGQTMVWASDHRNVGNGRQEITALEQNKSLETLLDFGDMGGAKASFELIPTETNGTIVVWRMETNMRDGVPVFRQPMATFFGFFMDKMVGADYEKGLAALKSVVESEA